jgi:acyl carrier protein
MEPKVEGAWNLHTLTINTPLDFFVLFSSVASVFGSPGQGAYAAANAFLDALSHHRRALGLPALTINWGPWSAVGMAAQANRGRRLATRGIDAIPPQQGLQILEQLLLHTQQETAQVVVVPANWQQVLDSFPAGREPTLLSQLAQARMGLSPSQSNGNKQDSLNVAALVAMEPEQRQALLLAHLQKELAIVLGLEAAEVNPQESLNNLGFDSLMMLELRQRIEIDLGIELPLESLAQDPSLAALSEKLLALLETSASQAG